MTVAPDREPDEARADTTPMIDVVFLMIVFFVCLDFRSLEAKLPAYLPKDHGSATASVAPREQLVVRVHVAERGTPVPRPHGKGHALEGHRVRWEVGPRLYHELADVGRELARLAAEPVRLPCVVEATPGVCYDDVARTTDACHAAGFTEITFAAGS